MEPTPNPTASPTAAVDVASQAAPSASASPAPLDAMLNAATDLSLWGLFLQADMVVKAVMLGLVLASVWSWAVIFDKWFTLGRMRRRCAKFEAKFWSGKPLEDLLEKGGGRARDPMTAVFQTGMREWQRATGKVSDRAGLSHTLPSRLERIMGVTIDRELDRLEMRLGILASVGSVAPFVGLFGTVWGIMNSFHAIGMAKNTNLAIVAPGIAEALFATALGLVAAIPAVVAYNKLSGDIDRLGQRLHTFANEFVAVLVRQLEDRG